MSDPKAPADSSQERGDRIESNLKKELSEKEDKICLKSNLDGNNKEEFPSSTLENDLDEAPDENLTEFVSSDTEIMNPEVESGDTDDNIETKHSWGDMDDSSMDSLTNQDLDAIKISSSDELKKTGLSFLEPGVSLAGDDFDSENQDDDLVLKWDDDDEEDGADLAIEGDQIDSDNVNNDGPTEEIDFDIVTAEDDESTMKPDSLADPIDSIHSQPEDAAESTEKSKYDTSDDTTNRVDTNNRITLAPVENLESHNNVTMETANATAKNIDSEAIIDAISDIKDPENDKEENNETIEPTASSELEDKEIMEVDETSKSLNSNGDKNIIEADKSDEKIDDSEENDELLSEIDAQIAELDASLSKSENEKKPTESSDVNTEKCDSLDHEVETVVNENININETEIMQKGKEASAGATDEKIVFQKTILSLESKIPELPESKINEKCSLSETRTHIENGNPDGLSKADSNQTFINTDIHTVTDKLNRTIEESCNVQVSDKTTAEDTKIDASVNEDSAVITESLANSTAILDNSTVNANIDSATAVNNDSFSPNTSVIEPAKHGLNEPNMMLEIPTQELIEFDESLNLTDDEKNTRVDTQQNIDSKSMQHESMSLDIVDQISQKDGNIRENIQDNLKRTDKPSNVDIETIIILPAMSIKDDVENSKQTGQGDEKQSLESETKTTEEPAVSLKKSIEQPKDIGQDVKKDSIEEVMLEEISKDNDLEKTGLENSASVESATPSVVEKTTLLQDVTPSDSIEQSKDTDDKEDGKIGIDSQTTEAIQPSTTKDVPQSTSAQKQMAPDSSDDDTEVTDSLGLLAECSRVAEDDDDQEISDREDDDDDFDGSPDESSNQPDQSEDSVQNSETDLPKLTASTSGPLDKDNDNAQGFEKTLHLTPELFDSLLANKEKLEDEPSALPEEVPDDGDMDVDDDIVCEEVVVAPNAKVVAPTTLIGDADPDVDEALDATLGEPDIDAVPDVDGDPDIGAGTDTADVPVIEGVESIDIDKHTEKMKTPTEQETQLEVPLVKESTLDDTEETSQSQLRTLLEHGSAETTTEKDSKVTAAAAVTSKDKAGEGAIVDLGEISSEEDVPEVKKDQNIDADVIKPTTTTKVTSRINTSEISIKTTISPKPPMVIPEVAKIKEPQTPVKAKYPLEVFNLDSDDEETPAAVPAEPGKPTDKCINNLCQSDASATYVPADSSSRMYYQCKKRGYICLPCLEPVHNTTEKLVAGIKNFTPLLELEVRERDLECVEILDSDSEDETDSVPHGDREKIQEPATEIFKKDFLKDLECTKDERNHIQSSRSLQRDSSECILERQLSAIINETWDKYQFERLLTDAQDQLFKEMDRIQMENKEINALLDECQTATDKLRDELYSTFSVPVEEQPPITIYDMPDKQFTCLETQSEVIKDVSNKRRLSDATESKAKRPSMTAEGDNNTESPKSTEGNKQDDDKDVSVVRLSAEAAPPSLPPIGEPVRPPLTPALSVYAMRHAFGSWIKARILEVTPKGQSPLSLNFTMCRVKFENKTNRNATKVLPARCLAYCEPSHVRMTIGTRVIALFKALSPDEKEPRRESYYSGVIAEIPNPVNKYRYLVFFDDGYAQYVSHADTRLVCEFSPLVWEEVHSFSREFVKEYLLAYPERPMVRLHTGQHLKTEWNGKWWASRVIAVDASLVQVYFEQDKRTEWIYRGSTRLAPLYLELQAAEKHSRARPLPRNRQNKLNMPYVEYTRTDEAETEKQVSPEADKIASFKAQHEAEIRRQRAVAKKSTTGVGHIPPPVPTPADTVTSRVVYYTPKNAIKPHKMVPHNCGPRCKRTDVLSLKELRTYNPLAKPLLSGWERQTARFKGHKEVAYRAPCGRRIRNMAELHRYLRLIDSDMGVDLFDFGPNTHCLAEFVLNKCIVGKKDLSHGKENVPVPCVNYYDDSLPEFCSYNTERTPTAGVPLNTDPDFLCGCDCTDDCEDKSKCACWKLTLEGARTIGLDGNVGYEYKRLPEPLPSGIYECNARCKCKSTCLNRVAQHPLQLKLQVFKTANRGWGIRALNDVPKGSFLCIYAGNLLTDATANLDGLNEGDEYLAELDYIEVVEQMKEGFEEDIPDADKQLDKKESAQQSDQESESTESEEEAGHSKSDDADGDFQPAYMPGVVAEFSKRLRKRDKKKKKKEEVKKEKEREKEKEKENKENADEDCITISDDEEIREPSRFAAQAGMGGEYVSKYRSVRTYFGKDEACYIMDAKVQGNIGRYLNHSCSPNVFVQNVFVDTHDPRFPWVAFFALSHIRAGTELTWNYNYDVGSVPGKALYCYCGAPNCRGRLL